jgi:hypothetical protein
VTTYVDAMAPLVATLVRITPDLLAAEASRETPDVFANELRDEELWDGLIARLEEDFANEAAVADALEQAAEETGLSTFALARAVDLASETLQLVGVKLRRRAAGEDDEVAAG